jgi:hypothetical protein
MRKFYSFVVVVWGFLLVDLVEAQSSCSCRVNGKCVSSSECTRVGTIVGMQTCRSKRNIYPSRIIKSIAVQEAL